MVPLRGADIQSGKPKCKTSARRPEKMCVGEALFRHSGMGAVSQEVRVRELNTHLHKIKLFHICVYTNILYILYKFIYLHVFPKYT